MSATTTFSTLKANSRELCAWLFEAALPLWWDKGTDRRGGGFHEVLRHNGEPELRDRRARVQARQSYVYAIAGRMGWTGDWREAAQHGLRALDARYRRGTAEYSTLVSQDGAIADANAMLYDQAFVLLALASLRMAMPELEETEAKARALAAAIIENRRHARGGYRETGAKPFLSNPHMHLFEAALAWCLASEDPFWMALADEIAALCLSRFIDPERGYLREHFDAEWSPARGELGEVVEPGHQFEWAWLLERFSRMRDRDDAHRAAEGLFECGSAGVDRARNVAVDELGSDLSVKRATARLWPQTERIKAALILADGAEGAARERYLHEAKYGCEALRLYLDTPLKGLWRDKMREDGSFVEEPAPASSFYHIICCIKALTDTAGAS